MRIFSVLLIMFVVVLSSAQSVQELEQQLQEASSAKEKMTLNYQLAEAWLKNDAKKSIEYAKAAHNKALEINDDGFAAEAGFMTSRGYNRTSDERNEGIWLESAIKFAKEAGDADLIIKTVDLRSRLAMRSRDERTALKVTQEAFDYFSNKGGKTISEMRADNEVQKGQLQRERKGLELEKQRLEQQIAGLKKNLSGVAKERDVITTQRDVLAQDKTQLAERQQVLEQEKAVVEQEISKKEEEIKTVSNEKAKALYIAEKKQRMIEALHTKRALDSIALEKTAIDLDNAKLLNERGMYIFYLLGAGILFAIGMAAMFFMRFRSKQKSSALLSKQNKIIEEERLRSDELLFNIMPVEVAKELKEKGTATAQQFPEATVLFSDFKNFTQIAELLSPEKLVEELNHLFKSFDYILSQYKDIEKIKTIGDAYLCASGLVKNKTIPKNIVKAALEMQEFLEDYKKDKVRRNEPFFEARIGLHSGPVVAGVVGLKKFAYDIWGDTVNIASRMEASCEPGKVNVSETTFGLIKYDFECQSRGRLDVKNKGFMEMYYVKKALR